MDATAKKHAKRISFNILALLIGIICLFPLLWLILSGFKPASDFLSYDFKFFPSDWTFQNYSELFTNELSMRILPRYSSIMWSMFATLLVAVTAVILSLYINSAAAYVFARLEFSFKRGLWIYYTLTMFMPNMAIMIPCYQICSALKLTKSFWVLILPGVVYVWSIFFYRQFYLSIPRSLEDAARIDGCGRIAIYFRLFLPMSAAPFVIMGIAVFQGFWNSYVWPILTIENPKLMQINQLIAFFKSSQRPQWHYLMAASAMACLPVLILLIFFQKFIKQGIKISGIK